MTAATLTAEGASGSTGRPCTPGTPRNGRPYLTVLDTGRSHHDRTPGAWMPLAPIPGPGRLPTLDEIERDMR